jgi:hypothetical protein
MPFTGGASTANIYPQWSLLQLNLSTIHSGVFRDFEWPQLSQLFSQIRTISLDLLPNPFKMWRKVECSGLKRSQVEQLSRI